VTPEQSLEKAREETRSHRHEAAVVILNYCTPGLVVDCLRSLEGQVDPLHHDVVVVDNCSPDSSADRIESEIGVQGWQGWARVVRSPVNGGFAAGNNVGILATDARVRILLNSDTILRPGALRALLDRVFGDDSPGIVGPRLEWPDGVHQISTFRFRTPMTELIATGRLGLLGRLMPGHVVAREVHAACDDLDWTSFACVAIRDEVSAAVGLLDESYFMYFEDMDYCRRARSGGFRVGHEPGARVVHLRGGTSDVKQKTRERKRRPGYYYAARSRYFRSWYGMPGLVAANVLWTAGFLLAVVRGKSRAVEREWRDIWRGPVWVAAVPKVTNG
jgi:N-acetylglucosaminyl-diphospho-decaprenol L-rhamnosyltransferase